MTYRVRRKSKVITTKLSNGDRFKVIRRPFKFPSGGWFWLVAMVASKSNRALNDWIRERNKRKRVKKLNNIGRHATCGSGDSFVEDRTQYYGEVVDMEAYALAKVCYHYQVPFVSFKYTTDGADEQAHEDWEKNLADGINEFKKQVLDVI